LNVSYSDNILELSSPSLELSLPSISTETLSGSFDFSLQSLTLIVANQIRGRFSFVSNSVELGINNFSLNNPSLFGEFRFRENTVAGSLELALNNQLKIGAVGEHDLSNNSGFAEIDMPRYGFSRLTPLSLLLEQSFLNGDIVAGNIAGRAELSWSRNADRSWNYSGPLDLNVQNLSGFYEDSFFVDLDTELSADLSSPLGVRSRNELSATLANLDAGVSVSNVEWRYEFDSADRQFSVYDLTTEVLGGNISVPIFDYSGEREENKLNVILTGLDLNYIVNLADYPNLLVDGLISGYLPLILRQDRLTIDGGLVAALQPGGSIRYTPSNPIPSSNPTVQLVNDTLSNYQFETLNTEVYYDENGDLRMQIQLRGTNPNMNAGQAINLNINITDNIPTLLRSLQASRVITDELEQRLAR